ncbi:hypothetical protein FOL47_004863 [Perkinsus chesapeaki]|uniref:C962R-like N-terminal AEP domain-containing protein n=1 Tax=Perkinsus chesapeaki TaxID=330153 RepID=A0A7J6M093_PERCH|nr:hypothetical protein FOL47_004863 [Perkinsus chesapeaki]
MKSPDAFVRVKLERVHDDHEDDSNEFKGAEIDRVYDGKVKGILDTSASVVKLKEDKEYNLGWLANVNSSLVALKGDLLVPGSKDLTSQPKEHILRVWDDGKVNVIVPKNQVKPMRIFLDNSSWVISSSGGDPYVPLPSLSEDDVGPQLAGRLLKEQSSEWPICYCKVGNWVMLSGSIFDYDERYESIVRGRLPEGCRPATAVKLPVTHGGMVSECTVWSDGIITINAGVYSQAKKQTSDPNKNKTITYLKRGTVSLNTVRFFVDEGERLDLYEGFAHLHARPQNYIKDKDAKSGESSECNEDSDSDSEGDEWYLTGDNSPGGISIATATARHDIGDLETSASTAEVEADVTGGVRVSMCGGLVMLQGSCTYVDTHSGKGEVTQSEDDRVGIAQLPMHLAPSTTTIHYVYGNNKWSRERIEIDPTGKIMSCSAKTRTLHKRTELSGIVFAPRSSLAKDDGLLDDAAGLEVATGSRNGEIPTALCAGKFAEDLSRQDWKDILEEVTSAYEDALERRHVKEKYPKCEDDRKSFSFDVNQEFIKYGKDHRREESEDWRLKMERTSRDNGGGNAQALRALRHFGEQQQQGNWKLSPRALALPQLRSLKNADKETFDKFMEIQEWWLGFDTNEKVLTHSTLMGNKDAFSCSGKWRIPDDPSVQKALFYNKAWLYKHGVHTYISEIQTPIFPFIEDIDFEGTFHDIEGSGDLDTIILDENLMFLKERVQALHLFFPDLDKFKCHVYSASGYNKGKERWKSSFHLVWPDLIVDGTMAPTMRNVTVEHFEDLTRRDPYFKLMFKRMMRFFDQNIWENVFDQTTASAKNGLRMPFCNKVSWHKDAEGRKQPRVEDRFSLPIGTIEFEYTRKEIGPKELERYRRDEQKRFDQAENDFKERLHASKDYRDIQGDRTSAHTSDKTSMDRSLAFAKALRKIGGDPRYLTDLKARWITGPLKKDELRDMDIETIAEWIARGSCRRGQYTTDDVTTPNADFVKAYEEADFELIEEIGLDAIKETDKWKKMTPCAQKGVLVRFQQYRQSRGLSTEGITVRTSKNKNRGKKKKTKENSQTTVQEEEEVKPPTGRSGFDFDYYKRGKDNGGESCIWRFSDTCTEFKKKFNEGLMDQDFVASGFGALRSCLNHPFGCSWSRNRNGRGVVWRSPPEKDLGDMGFYNSDKNHHPWRGSGSRIWRDGCREYFVPKFGLREDMVEVRHYEVSQRVMLMGNCNSQLYKDVASLLELICDGPDPALYKTLPSCETADDGDVLAGVMDDVSARNELQAYRDELDSSDVEDDDDELVPETVELNKLSPVIEELTDSH